MSKLFFSISALQSHSTPVSTPRQARGSGFAADLGKAMELHDLNFAMQAMGMLDDSTDETGEEDMGGGFSGLADAFSGKALSTLAALESRQGEGFGDLAELPADEAAILGMHALRRQVNTEPVSPELDMSSLGNLADLSSLRLPVSRAYRTYEIQSTVKMDPKDAETLAQVLESEQAALYSVLKARHSNPIPGDALDVLRKVKFGFLPVSGTLAAIFESGTEGVACIGHDGGGGTSYGKYQLSSRKGMLGRFLDFLDERDAEWAGRLRSAGKADTGGVGGKMPGVWREIAAENPRRFELFQDEFILQTSYKPALQGILQETGINVGEHSPALKEVLWSTSVQHGPAGAASIFSRVLKSVAASSPEDFDKACIESIYMERRDQFTSSNSRVRKAVQSRLSQEKRLALALLDDHLV